MSQADTWGSSRTKASGGPGPGMLGASTETSVTETKGGRERAVGRRSEG